jgi:hypothetical protein
MLRHIVSVSLAMTACATLIPTKANAFIFTLTPLDNLQRNRGEQIGFILGVDPQGESVLIRRIYNPSILNYDTNELAFFRTQPLIDLSEPVTRPRNIASFVFDVINPIKDGRTDLRSVTVDYRIRSGDGSFVVGNNTLDVEPVPEQGVPEPLTILGAATALGYGAILKRKYSKRTES